MNSLNKNIPVGSIVEMKNGRQYVCLNGFGMMSFLVGSAISGYPAGKRQWESVKIYCSGDTEACYKCKRKKFKYQRMLHTQFLDGMLIKKLIRKGWRKK